MTGRKKREYGSTNSVLHRHFLKLRKNVTVKMSSDSAKGCEYIPEILHLPQNPEGAVKEVMDLLNSQLKLSLDDERTYIGKFTAFDKFGNFVLTNAVEYFREETREMQMVIVPIASVKNVATRPLPPEESQKAN